MKSLTVINAEFAAAHLYWQKKWSDEKNLETFGKCFSEHGHGHNYRFEVGFLDSKTAIESLQTFVQDTCNLLDHKHLNFTVPEFKELIPTTENIAKYLLRNLEDLCPNERISYIKLFETENLWVEICQ